MALIKKMIHTAPDGTKTVRRFLTNKALSKAFLAEVAETFERNPEGDGKVYIGGVHTHNMHSDGTLTKVEKDEDEPTSP